MIIRKYNVYKYILLLFVFLLSFFSYGQGDFFHICDSTISNGWKKQYYSFKGKYPVSSERLVEKANQAILYHSNNINGYITLRFTVNCEGYTGNFEIYQIHRTYMPIEFEELFISELLIFVGSLNQWPKAYFGKKPIDYYTYLSFKVNYGIITEIIP